MTAALVLLAFALGGLAAVSVHTQIVRFSWRHMPDDRFEETVIKLRAMRARYWKIGGRS